MKRNAFTSSTGNVCAWMRQVSGESEYVEAKWFLKPSQIDLDEFNAFYCKAFEIKAEDKVTYKCHENKREEDESLRQFVTEGKVDGAVKVERDEAVRLRYPPCDVGLRLWSRV